VRTSLLLSPPAIFDRNESSDTILSSSTPHFELDGVELGGGTKRKQREEDDAGSVQSARSAKSHRSAYSEISESWDHDDPQVQLAKYFPEDIPIGLVGSGG